MTDYPELTLGPETSGDRNTINKILRLYSVYDKSYLKMRLRDETSLPAVRGSNIESFVKIPETLAVSADTTSSTGKTALRGCQI